MKRRVYSVYVTFSMPEEAGKFPSLRDVTAGVKMWAEDWSYAEMGRGKVFSAHSERRLDLEARLPKQKRHRP
jgi:hypothetical protein